MSFIPAFFGLAVAITIALMIRRDRLRVRHGIAWLLVEVLGLLGYSYACLKSLNIKYNVIIKVLAVGGSVFGMTYFMILLATNINLTFGIGIGSLLTMGVLYTSYMRVKNIF